MNTSRLFAHIFPSATLIVLSVLSSSLVGCASKNEATALMANNCLDKSKSIFVSTEKHKLYLCKNNKVVAEYRVSLGKGGYGKTTDGDNKTPLGTYKLGKPGPSSDGFYMFIPVVYPTPEQKTNGYTGHSIGVHGPYGWLRFLGPTASLLDWTKGCIAVSFNSEIYEISKWANKEDVKTVTIE